MEMKLLRLRYFRHLWPQPSQSSSQKSDANSGIHCTLKGHSNSCFACDMKAALRLFSTMEKCK